MDLRTSTRNYTADSEKGFSKKSTLIEIWSWLLFKCKTKELTFILRIRKRVILNLRKCQKIKNKGRCLKDSFKFLMSLLKSKLKYLDSFFLT